MAPNNSTTRWRRSLRSNCRLIDEVTRASLTEVLDQSHNRLNTTKHGIYEVPRGRAPGHADHLAAAAHMPRIETMFARLTQQLPLFVTLMGLTYRYAIDDTVDDAKRILAAIRTRDVDGAVSAWRRKVDNAARYMTAQPAPAKPNNSRHARMPETVAGARTRRLGKSRGHARRSDASRHIRVTTWPAGSGVASAALCPAQ